MEVIRAVYDRAVAPFPFVRVNGNDWSAVLDVPGAIASVDFYVEGDVVEEAGFVARRAERRQEEQSKELLCDACGAPVREYSGVGWVWFTLDGEEGYRWFRLCQPCAERCRVEEAGKNGPPWVIQLKVLTPANQREWEFFPFGEFP